MYTQMQKRNCHSRYSRGVDHSQPRIEEPRPICILTVSEFSNTRCQNLLLHKELPYSRWGVPNAHY